MSSCRIPRMYQPSRSKEKMPTLYFVLKFCSDEEFIIQSTVVLFRSSCRIKILYQIAQKAADKRQDLAKYIYIKNSVRNPGFLTFLFFSFLFSAALPVCGRPGSALETTTMQLHLQNLRKASMLASFAIPNYTNYSAAK